MARFRRAGEATARQLQEAKTWRTSAGDELHGEAGDWLVQSASGGERTVGEDEFPRLYEHVKEDRYKRRGTVTARQVSEPEVVSTLEGEATANPGDWIVTDDGSNSWPVPAEVFGTTYVPMSD